MLGYSLGMGDVLARNATGATPWDITAKVRGYRRRTRDIGGFWTAEGTFWTGADDPLVSKLEAEELFLSGMGNHVVESFGSTSVFEGFISAMTFTRDGVSARRDLNKIVNSLKLTYSHFTGNLLLNGSAEIGSIGGGGDPPNALPQTGTGVSSSRGFAYGSSGHGDYPYPVLSISTAWVSHGTHSFYMDCSPCTLDIEEYDGQIILTTGVAVVAGGKYQVSGTINYDHFDSGYPGRSVEMQVGCTNYTLCSYATPAAEGVYYFSLTFDAPNDATGNLIVYVTAFYRTLFYIDGLSLQEVGSRKETPYASNSDSIALYGLTEDVIVCGGMGDDEALTRRDNFLSDLSWPRSVAEKTGGGDGLTIEVSGYVFKLGMQSASIGGLLAASTHIANLIPLSSFVSLGYVATNALLTYVAENKPTRIWEAVQCVTESGGTGSTKYICGVGPGRKFNYQPRDTAARYRYKSGQWYGMDGTLCDAQAMQPAIVFLEDLPVGPGVPPNGLTIDDPRYMWVYEWEYDADSNIATPSEYKSVWE